MRGFPGNPVPVSALKASHWAADVIYTPIETEFIKAAAAKGARVLNGGGMCVHQAVEAFRLFTGIEPDVARMHRTFATALAARDKAATPTGTCRPQPTRRAAWRWTSDPVQTSRDDEGRGRCQPRPSALMDNFMGAVQQSSPHERT